MPHDVSMFNIPFVEQQYPYCAKPHGFHSNYIAHFLVRHLFVGDTQQGANVLCLITEVK